ncbi:MAG: type II toxin-antitoxin system VapC family toxin [Trueperaceae bacterium]|nr:MAG: type II toxin-antitoxin system VapC family toxin [Trueperaceae bacterium]
MRYLLDTHTLAWAVGDPSLLGSNARQLLEDTDNELLVSPVSIWEMSIKHHSGRWPEVGPFLDEERFSYFCQRLGLQELVVRIPHTRLAGSFSVAHKDPFDRLLAAQALLEGMPLISKDPQLDPFAVTRLW